MTLTERRRRDIRPALIRYALALGPPTDQPPPPPPTLLPRQRTGPALPLPQPDLPRSHPPMTISPKGPWQQPHPTLTVCTRHPGAGTNGDPSLCAYRQGDPDRCDICHAPWDRITTDWGETREEHQAQHDGRIRAHRAETGVSAPATLSGKTRRAMDSGFRRGQTVRTSTPRSPQFDDRIGTVTSTNEGEVGVRFHKGKSGPDAWFLPAELTRVRP